MTAPDAPARILVVDDEENITYLLRTALRHFGFEVDVASDGRAGLTAARTGTPDLILLDVMLPDVDGFEVLRRLRGEGLDTPVLFRWMTKQNAIAWPGAGRSTTGRRQRTTFSSNWRLSGGC